MLFLGDIMQHQEQLSSAYKGAQGRNNPLSYDYSSYFKFLKTDFENSDIVVANIETTFAPPPYSGYPSFGSPASLAIEAYKAGINLFLAANNHILDKGKKGLEGSMALFDSLGVPYLGIYKEESNRQKRHPLFINKKGFKIALLNYTYGTNGIPTPAPYVVNRLDSTIIKEDLKRAQEGSPDIVIVLVHWGEEYHIEPSRNQLMWERLFYKYGATLIVGSHPHVPQKVVTYFGNNGGVEHITAYSLGNAISNMSAKNTRIGVMLQIELVKEHFTNRITIEKPKIEYIWTVRPTAKNNYYSILPIDKYLNEPHNYPFIEEKELIKSYYQKFKNINDRENYRTQRD